MNAYKKDMESCNRYEERICAKKGKDVPFVERRKERGAWVYRGTVEKEVYQTLEVALNGTSIFCRKEEWKKEDGTRLLISQ